MRRNGSRSIHDFIADEIARREARVSKLKKQLEEERTAIRVLRQTTEKGAPRRSTDETKRERKERIIAEVLEEHGVMKKAMLEKAVKRAGLKISRSGLTLILRESARFNQPSFGYWELA